MAKIAMPLAADFEDSEFQKPYEALRDLGHEVVVIGEKAGQRVEGKRKDVTATIDCQAGDVSAEDFDAVVIPGGFSPDHLRTNKEVVDFVQHFDRLGRPLAAVCHGPQLLIEADAIRGRRMTSFASVRKDLENAGAKWVDEEVCVDGDLITSRKPADLDAFIKTIASRLDAGTNTAQTARAAAGQR